MSHSTYNIPAFSSSERLAALARYVSDITNDKQEIHLQNNQHNENSEQFILRDMQSLSSNKENGIKSMCETWTKSDKENLNIYQNNIQINEINTENDIHPFSITPREVVEMQSFPSDTENGKAVLYTRGQPDTENECIDLQNTGVNKNLLFTVSSAGFNHGDFAEFSLGQRVFIPKKISKRGITVLYLTTNFTTFHAWNFDFYKPQTRISTNSNFISLLRKLPGNTYFAMSIKDDAHKNLFEGTKNFLTKIIGCKSIWKLNYRNSWCAIVYKKTEKSFEVITESYNPSGVAEVQHLIIDPLSRNSSLKGINYMNLNETEKILPISILKNSITNYSSVGSIDTVNNTENNKHDQNFSIPSIPQVEEKRCVSADVEKSRTSSDTNNKISNVNFSKVSMVKVMEQSGNFHSFPPQPYIISHSKMTESSQNILNESINKVNNEVQELKQLVLEQTNLIKKLLEANTSNKS
jgi:hypothetical protein